MTTAQFLVGDVFDRLAELPDGSVDLVLTSPPFLALRSYLPPDHPDKGREIGSEPDPASFVDTLLALTAEWRRVLAPHGSIAVELGDTYAGSGGAGGDYNPGGMRPGQDAWDGSSRRANASEHKYAGPWANPGFGDGFKGGNPGGAGWPLAKSLTLVPETYRFALAYGINPHTGQESPAGQWRIRNVVRWVRPNPPVGALGDKYRPATSEMVVACVSDKRWFDLDGVRTPYQHPNHPQVGKSARGKKAAEKDGNWGTFPDRKEHPAGAPPLDWWNIPTHPYKGAHYATWPPALCTVPVESMCPREVCRTCGEPRRRITEHVGCGGPLPNDKPKVVSTGWTDCGHDDWRPGVVLDPFAGSGTTLTVATGHGRDAIGIDLDERNAELARERVGMFLQVDHQGGRR